MTGVPGEVPTRRLFRSSGHQRNAGFHWPLAALRSGDSSDSEEQAALASPEQKKDIRRYAFLVILLLCGLCVLLELVMFLPGFSHLTELDVTFHSILSANYNADLNVLLIPPVSMNMLDELAEVETGANGTPVQPGALATITAILVTPVPTVTPRPGVTPLIPTDNPENPDPGVTPTLSFSPTPKPATPTVTSTPATPGFTATPTTAIVSATATSATYPTATPTHQPPLATPTSRPSYTSTPVPTPVPPTPVPPTPVPYPLPTEPPTPYP